MNAITADVLDSNDGQAAVAEILRQVVGLVAEGHSVTLVLEIDGRRISVSAGQTDEPAQATPPAAARTRQEPRPPREMERNILEALGDQTMSGQEIARAAGYAYESHLKACLADMRRRGLLAGASGARGYCVPRPGGNGH
jgi:biotin operon repressor